ncbi:MAG: phosphoenolpyruvate synthase [Candidatus Aenigmarchaeota archaeon]|nr:phosphoenolpyruvate synthase [Candidatus Aenigmarchaeota archaeon]
MSFIITKKDFRHVTIEKVGGKALNLAKLSLQGFPVPEAFFITADAYQEFIKKNRIKSKILKIIENTKFSNIDSLKQSSEQIKDLIVNAKMPDNIKNEIRIAYKNLDFDGLSYGAAGDFIRAGRDIPFVAVRSSGITEDIKGASSAGQYETFLNIRGLTDLIEAVKKCWASLYTPRVMYYRYKHKQSQDTSLCVIVQKMINSEAAGVVFTVDPSKPEQGKDNIVIEASWGLGETIVQGQVNPDYYVVDKRTGKILSIRIGKKYIMRIRDPYTGETVVKNVLSEKINEQVMSEQQIVALAAYAKKIENYYGNPQDIEFAIERGRIYILQSRAVTVLEEKKTKAIQGKPILTGFPASPGIAKGPVKIIHDLSELNKIKKGDILVTTMTSPDMVPAMEKSAGIITDEGGTSCHASIVSRELGIPCIVGTKTATKELKEGQLITMDATNGNIFEGDVSIQEEQKHYVQVATKTKIKVNLAFPETAKPEIAEKTDGVGLLRIEHMLTKTGMHPFEYIRQGKQDELTDILVGGIGHIAEIFKDKPVYVRSLDVRTDEFSNMKGGENEPKESNPMLGWHGIRRSLEVDEILRSEMRAISKLHEKGFTNIHYMLPFVINVSELQKVKQIAKEVYLPDTCKIGIMIETPAAALSIEDFCKEGLSFVSFGSNDLTQLTLGIDRNNENLISLFDELHPSMKFMFKHVIEICKKYKVETSICGELPSNRKEAVEFLVNLGIDSLSVNIDAIDKVRSWVAEVEQSAS